MIKEIDVTKIEVAQVVLAVQLPAYKVEANLIGYDGIPALNDTVSTLQQCGETFFGYYNSDELCGVISIKVTTEEIDIHRLTVHPKHFRKGIAQELLNFIDGHFKPKRIIVSTGTENTPAILFYQKNGFKITKEMTVNEQLSLTFFEKRK